MVVLPRAEIDDLTALLRQLPGIDGSAARRAFLTLVWPDQHRHEFPPDAAIESGWVEIVEHLGRPPFDQAVTRLVRLLSNIGGALAPGELVVRVEAMAQRVERLTHARSYLVFLARLGVDPSAPGNDSVASLDTVFVAPKQYAHAFEILNQEQLLFLCGDPHMGKTFCALHMLWQDFRDRGREPYWRRAVMGRADARPALESLLIEGASIYIEDPFGRTTPLDNSDDVSRALRELMLAVKRHNVRIVATSRTAVLRAAITDSLERYVVTLSQELLLEKAYDDGSLQQIALNYLDAYRPRWLRSEIDAGQCARRISAQLPAPHNIREFVSATRHATDPTEAFARIEAFRDIVQEYADVFRRLDGWVVGALLVITAASDQHLPYNRLAWLFEQLQPDRKAHQTFDAALRTLRDYVTPVAMADDSLHPIARHPSIEEAVEVLCRGDESLLELNWLLMQATHPMSDEAFDRISIRILVTYADRWAESAGRLDVLDAYFDNPRLEIREASRHSVLHRFADLREEAAEIIMTVALRSWGDRMLLRLFANAGSLGDAPYERLAVRLCSSNDSQTRYLLVDQIRHAVRPRAQELVCRQLIKDPDRIVRRLAILRSVEHLQGRAPLVDSLRQAVATLAARDRDWLRIVVSQLPNGTQWLETIGLSLGD